ncbi:MAG: hypothetical protein EOM90_18770 [Alphaproteobacteria bacterium]|nr:hypothetical protein [Alphaproteobacteria bacterium]
MPVKDVFQYTDRWDSVGLRCFNCSYVNENEWPDIGKKYACKLHGISLAVQLDGRGYVEGEWFCKTFHDNGTANKNALATFNNIKSQLEERVLYGFYGKDGNLKEIPFDQCAGSK